MPEFEIIPPQPYREDGWEVIEKHTDKTVRCGLTWAAARKALEATPKHHMGTPDGIFTVAVDLHGTLAEHPDDWTHATGAAQIGSPLPGAREAMQAFKDAGYRTVINSVLGDRETIREWLTEHSIPCDYINESPWGNDTETSGKIDADVYVDDRGLHFKGDWDEARRHVDHRARHELQNIAKRFVRKSWARLISEAWQNGALIELETAADYAELHGITDEGQLRDLGMILGGSTNDPHAYGEALKDITAILRDRWNRKQLHAAGPDIREWQGGKDR